MKFHCSLLAVFKNGDKRKRYRKIGKKLIIFYSNKMQSQLNASKASQAIPAGSLKSKSHLKSTQKQVKSSNRS